MKKGILLYGFLILLILSILSMPSYAQLTWFDPDVTHSEKNDISKTYLFINNSQDVIDTFDITYDTDQGIELIDAPNSIEVGINDVTRVEVEFSPVIVEPRDMRATVTSRNDPSLTEEVSMTARPSEFGVSGIGFIEIGLMTLLAVISLFFLF